MCIVDASMNNDKFEGAYGGECDTIKYAVIRYKPMLPDPCVQPRKLSVKAVPNASATNGEPIPSNCTMHGHVTHAA